MNATAILTIAALLAVRGTPGPAADAGAVRGDGARLPEAAFLDEI